ncbi:TSN17 protein, partial [Polyodon spathula]|nr:TSN17 protein [Polyodon spathula]
MSGKHHHYKGPEVSCCVKYFLFGFNIIFWLLGASFLAIGLWAWAEKGVLSNISSITDLGGFDPVWLFMVVGAVMFILGFAGCIGALRENTHLLKFFSVFLGLIFFLELTAGILAFVFKDWIKDQLNFFINNNVKAYRDDIDLQNLIDFAQEYWSCCGAHGPNDWNLNIYFNCTDMNPSRERCGVPFSCCVKDPAEDVLNTQCGYDVRLKMGSSMRIGAPPITLACLFTNLKKPMMSPLVIPFFVCFLLCCLYVMVLHVLPARMFEDSFSCRKKLELIGSLLDCLYHLKHWIRDRLP